MVTCWQYLLNLRCISALTRSGSWSLIFVLTVTIWWLISYDHKCQSASMSYFAWIWLISCWMMLLNSVGCTFCNRMYTKSMNRGIWSATMKIPNAIVKTFSSWPKLMQRKLVQSLPVLSIQSQRTRRLTDSRFKLCESHLIDEFNPSKTF